MTAVDTTPSDGLWDGLNADHGTFWLVNASTQGLILGGQFGADLDDVEEALTSLRS